MTVIELKEELDRLGISYAATDRKADLIELLKGGG
ncbi:HeH/LEM domain-containing protein [Listeria booriae]|nr:HeH/LEM domain-containing protein [Listeria booriae]